MVEYEQSIFQNKLIEIAKKNLVNIVLPESEDDRILEATSFILKNDIAKITLLGDEKKIRNRAKELKIDLFDVNILNILQSGYYEKYVKRFMEIRKHKGITLQEAKNQVLQDNYFATMMVNEGDADGLVCGAKHTTADTVIPAFQIIKTCPGIDIVSSVFFMDFGEKILLYADCAINTNPTAEQLAQITKSTVQTAKNFDIDPKVALLSYSTGLSGKGKDVDLIKNVASILLEDKVDFDFTGPIQYDAAVDSKVAEIKLPEDKVAGNANVMIFPNLTAGNICYKAVQRCANICAIGPILQGLNKPVNDLSRGATVQDIIDTIIVTAVQASNSKCS